MFPASSSTTTTITTPADASVMHTAYHQEFNKYRTCDYIPRLQDEYRESQAADGNGMDGAINSQWREKICEWKYQVVDHFRLKREIVSVAMNYLDRCLATLPAVDRSSFQLLAMTCLYVSIKLNHHTHLIIPGSDSTLNSLLELSRGFFSTRDLERKELELLTRLEWHVHPPTSQFFLEHFHGMYLQALEQHVHDQDMPMDDDPSVKREVLQLAHFFVELATMDYFFVLYLPSQVALAALLTAHVRLGQTTNLSVLLPGYEDSPELRACSNRMSRLYDRILLDDRRMPAAGSDSPVSVRMET